MSHFIDRFRLSDKSQGILAFVETNVPSKRYEYAVLVTDLEHELLTIAQLYRDRAHAENTFDELKHQWGWGGVPPTISPAVGFRRWQWHSFTTGGAYLCG